MSYELLKNKMENGTPFLKADALRWIEALPLEVTPEQVEELKTIAESQGLDFLPSDGAARLTRLEEENRELKAMIAKLTGQPVPEEVTVNA